MKILFLSALCLFLATLDPQPGFAAKRQHPEKTYQEYWCRQSRGVTEARQDDQTRVDCLTEDFAIEFDFGSKWAEAIGQSLHYALKTGREPGIVLILEHPSDIKYWQRLNAIVEKYRINIRTWKMTPEDLLGTSKNW